MLDIFRHKCPQQIKILNIKNDKAIFCNTDVATRYTVVSVNTTAQTLLFLLLGLQVPRDLTYAIHKLHHVLPPKKTDGHLFWE